MPFTKEELEAMARADAKIEENFRMTHEEVVLSSLRDKNALDQRRKATYGETRRRYYQKNRDEICRKAREQRAADPEKARAYFNDYYKKNRERIRAQQREYGRRYREKNREMLREKDRARREAQRAQ